MGCELCSEVGGELLWQGPLCRIVLVNEPGYPGFCRVIWRSHVREMTDLSEPEREFLMRTVFSVEAVLRELLQPHKINLASLGNIAPHLHWHVIPRFENDPHFPQPVWGQQQRDPQHETRADLGIKLAARLASMLG
ncbi:MAG: HIT family protein [Burkholderiales bacterium]|nr:HIT family protein [Burkholderiales bacterium]